MRKVILGPSFEGVRSVWIMLVRFGAFLAGFKSLVVTFFAVLKGLRAIWAILADFEPLGDFSCACFNGLQGSWTVWVGFGAMLARFKPLVVPIRAVLNGLWTLCSILLCVGAISADFEHLGGVVVAFFDCLRSSWTMWA